MRCVVVVVVVGRGHVHGHVVAVESLHVVCQGCVLTVHPLAVPAEFQHLVPQVCRLGGFMQV